MSRCTPGPIRSPGARSALKATVKTEQHAHIELGSSSRKHLTAARPSPTRPWRSCSTSTRRSRNGTYPRGRPTRDSSAAPSSPPWATSRYGRSAPHPRPTVRAAGALRRPVLRRAGRLPSAATSVPGDQPARPPPGLAAGHRGAHRGHPIRQLLISGRTSCLTKNLRFAVPSYAKALNFAHAAWTVLSVVCNLPSVIPPLYDRGRRLPVEPYRYGGRGMKTSQPSGTVTLPSVRVPESRSSPRWRCSCTASFLILTRRRSTFLEQSYRRRGPGPGTGGAGNACTHSCQRVTASACGSRRLVMARQLAKAQHQARIQRRLVADGILAHEQRAAREMVRCHRRERTVW